MKSYMCICVHAYTHTCVHAYIHMCIKVLPRMPGFGSNTTVNFFVMLCLTIGNFLAWWVNMTILLRVMPAWDPGETPNQAVEKKGKKRTAC